MNTMSPTVPNKFFESVSELASSLNAPVVPSCFQNLKNDEVMSSPSSVNNPYHPDYYTLYFNRLTHNPHSTRISWHTERTYHMACRRWHKNIHVLQESK